MDQLKIVTVQNPFDRRNRDVAFIDHQGRTVAELVAASVPANLPVTVSLNGEVILPERQTSLVPRRGDVIVIVPTVHGGETGKQILRVVIVVVATIVGALLGQVYLGPLLAGMMGGATAGAMAGAAIGAGIGSLAGGLLANAIIPPAAPRVAGMEAAQVSNSYSWNPVTTQQQGIVIARIYGKMLVHGNVTAAFLENGTNTKGDAISYVNGLLGIGYGPYKSLAEFTINDQPLSGTADVPGLKGVEIHSRLGYLNQQVVPNFNDTKTEHPLSVKITKASPYVYLTPGNDFDQLEVEVAFPGGLYYANDQGGLSKVEVQFKIEIAPEGSSVWVPIAQQTRQAPGVVGVYERWSAGYWAGGYYPETDGEGSPTGRTIGSEPVWVEVQAGSQIRADHSDGEYAGTDNYDGGITWSWRWIGTYGEHIGDVVQNDYIAAGDKTAPFRLTFKSGSIATKGRYQIRVSRLTDEWNDTRHGENLYLSSVREVVYDDFTYPRMALVGIRALATDQLSGSFAFSCMVEGALIRVYDGASWTVQYSINPAWTCFDILTQPVFNDDLTVSRYDGIDPGRLDIPTFLAWAQFCNTLVPDGKGGQEPRVTFNGIFDSEMTMWEAALQVCRIGRATLLWNGINISVAIDQAVTPVQLFTVGNIEKDGFKVDYLSLSERSSEIEADFINAEKGYERDRLSVIDPDLQNKSSKVATNLFGLTKPSEVWRHLQYQLNCNKYLTRTVQFQADIDAIVCTIGDVINVQHDVPRWGDAGGRLVAATANSVTLDKEVTIEAGKAYGVMVKIGKTDHLVERIISNAAGPATILTFATPMAEIPEQYDVYAFGETTKVTKPFRVILVEPNSDLRATITGIEYNASIYGSDAGQPVIPTQNYSAEPAFKSVLDLAAEERIEDRPDGTVADLIFVSWTRPVSNRVKEFEIWADYGAGYEYVRTTAETSVSFPAAKTGVVGIKVRTVNRDGLKQPLVEAPSKTLTIYGTLMTVPNVTGLALDGYEPNAMEFTGKDIPLRWNYRSPRENGLTEPAGPGRASSWFKYYKIEVYNPNGTLRWTDYKVDEKYLYTYEMNCAHGNGTPERNLTFKLRIMTSWEALSSAPAVLTVSNPSPPAITVTAAEAFRGLSLEAVPSSAIDRAGYVFHASQTAGFTPTADTLVYSGPVTYLYATKLANGTPIGDGTWYVKGAEYDVFGATGLNWSPQVSATLTSAQILPDDLYTGLRVDFLLRDSRFYFGDHGATPTPATKTTLYWTAGSITRGTDSYTLAGGNLANAQNSYIVATLNGDGTATLSLADITAGLPAMASNQIILGTTSSAPNSVGNYLAFMRQANSMLVEGAIFRDATILNAHIVSLHGNKIMAGTLIVGENVIMGPSATITWSQVTSSPTIPTNTNQLTDGANLGATATWSSVTGTGKPQDNANYTTNTNQLTDGAGLGQTAAWSGVSGRPDMAAYMDKATWITQIGSDYLFTGHIAVDNLYGNTLTGKTIQTATSGQRVVIDSTNQVMEFYGDDTWGGGVQLAAKLSLGSSILGTLQVGGSNWWNVAIQGRSYAIGVWGIGNGNTSKGVVGECLGTGYSFYANGAAGSTDYGTFTGAHDGLILKGTPFAPGDIVVDTLIVDTLGVSNAIAVNELSSYAQQPNVLGVIVWAKDMIDDNAPHVLQDMTSWQYAYQWAAINSLGEGQVNVCRDGGDIRAGDYICSSSRAGKGMRQIDNILRNYTVAKAREDCRWVAGEDDIRQIACTYHCG